MPVEVGRLADHLCGRFRPGHFSGVATVVLKLFESCNRTAAYFGEKDAQQLAVVRRLVSDFNVPTNVIGVPTVREPDGLALSSRNQRLDPDERQLAPALFRALGGEECHRRRRHERHRSEAARRRQIPSDPLRLEDFELVDPMTFSRSNESPPGRRRRRAVGGTTRLIDNVRCVPGI